MPRDLLAPQQNNGPKDLLAGVTPPKPAQPGFFEQRNKSLQQGPMAQVSEGAINLAKGAVKGVGSTLFGLAKLGTGIGNVAAKVPGFGFLKGDMGQKPQVLEPKGTAQKIGFGVEQLGEFFLPAGAVARAGKIAEAGIEASKLAPAAQTAAKLATKAGLGAAEFGGVTAAQTGEAPSKGTLATGAAFPLVGSAIGAGAKGIMGTLDENVTKAIGFRGKMGISNVQEKIPQATRALKILSDKAPEIVVKDAQGVEKAFEPSKATFMETAQAFTKAKDSVYKQYSELASKAGDKGAQFTPKDFNSVLDVLKQESKDSTGATKSKVNSLISDLQENFGDKNGDFQNIPFDRIQGFIEKVNTDINPLSDKAGSVVSQKLSQSMRDILDKKISSATGEGYQALRNQYRDLKSIENDLVTQVKRSANKTGQGFSKWVEGYGTLDTIVAGLTGSPTEAVRGVGLAAFGKLMGHLRDPEVNLQRAFGQLTEGEKKGSDLGAFMFGGKAAPITGSQQKNAKTIGEFINRGTKQ